MDETIGLKIIEALERLEARLSPPAICIPPRPSQTGKWFRWNHDNGRGYVKVTVVDREAGVCKFDSEEKAAKFVADADELIRDLIASSEGTEIKTLSKRRAVKSV
jgi:hypothetical protein